MTDAPTSFEDYLAGYECHLIVDETSHEELVELDKDLPSDTHLVRYKDGDGEHICGIRACKKSSIFDALHDSGAEVLEISNGYGALLPKLFGYQPKETDKSKKK